MIVRQLRRLGVPGAKPSTIATTSVSRIELVDVSTPAARRRNVPSRLQPPGLVDQPAHPALHRRCRADLGKRTCKESRASPILRWVAEHSSLSVRSSRREVGREADTATTDDGAGRPRIRMLCPSASCRALSATDVGGSMDQVDTLLVAPIAARPLRLDHDDAWPTP